MRARQWIGRIRSGFTTLGLLMYLASRWDVDVASSLSARCHAHLYQGKRASKRSQPQSRGAANKKGRFRLPKISVSPTSAICRSTSPENSQAPSKEQTPGFKPLFKADIPNQASLLQSTFYTTVATGIERLMSTATASRSLRLRQPPSSIRFHLLRSPRRHVSTTETATEKASEAVVKSKETATSLQSKASEGLTRVQSTAGPAISGAARGIGNALGRIGGRTGRLVGYIEGSRQLAFMNVLAYSLQPPFRPQSTTPGLASSFPRSSFRDSGWRRRKSSRHSPGKRSNLSFSALSRPFNPTLHRSSTLFAAPPPSCLLPPHKPPPTALRLRYWRVYAVLIVRSLPVLALCWPSSSVSSLLVRCLGA